MTQKPLKKTHIPVMLKEALDGLNIQPNGFYIDCTLGEGGHSFEITKKLDENGLLLSIDRDQSAIDFVRDSYKEEIAAKHWILFHSNYSKIRNALNDKEVNSVVKERKANGILMDLGLSSRQLEIEPRGFSYIEEKQPLDMRMDETLAVTAKDLMNGLQENELAKLFTIYGEEKFARPIAREIKANLDKLSSVGDLVKLVYKVIPSRVIKLDKHHPARRVFQALRIAVNDEMNSLTEGLVGAFESLEKQGRLVVITFHSLEDRIVKNKFEEFGNSGNGMIITKKAILPSEKEIYENPRAHSAKMRVIEKVN